MLMDSAAEQKHSEDWLAFLLGRGGVCDRQNDLSLYAIFIRSGGHNVDGQRS